MKSFRTCLCKGEEQYSGSAERNGFKHFNFVGKNPGGIIN